MQLIGLKAYSNCWICEGWTQMKFIFVSGVTVPRKVGEDENVFIRFSFEDYAPDYMAPEGAGTYSSTRMVPPGPLRYFFTIGDQVLNAEQVASSEIKEGAITAVSERECAENG